MSTTGGQPQERGGDSLLHVLSRAQWGDDVPRLRDGPPWRWLLGQRSNSCFLVQRIMVQ